MSNRDRIVGSVLALCAQTPGVSTDCRALGAVHWRRELKKLRRSGFTAIDLLDSWLPFAELTERELDDLGSALVDVGLTARGLGTSRHSLIAPGHREENLAYTLRVVDAAARLRIPLVGFGFHPALTAEQQQSLAFWEYSVESDDRSDETWEFAATRVRELCAYAAQCRIIVSAELYEDSLVRSAPDVERLMREVGAQNLGVNPDLGNTFRSATPQREPWLTTLRASLPYMNYWHLKNYMRSSLSPDGPFSVTPTALGEGGIDYRLAIREALVAGYSGPFVIEHYGGDALLMQERGRRYLERLLGELHDDLMEENSEL